MEIVFQIAALTSLALSVFMALFLCDMVYKFKGGLTFAIRGVFPQIMVYRGSSPSPLDPEDTSRIVSAIRNACETALPMKDVFLRDVLICAVGSDINGGDEFCFKTAIRGLDEEHLKSLSLTGLLPVNAIRKLIRNPNSIALSRDLYNCLKSNGALKGNRNMEIDLHGGNGGQRKVDIVQVFDMLEGRYARFAFSGKDLADFLTGQKHRPNLIGVELTGTFDSETQAAALIRKALNPNGPVTNLEMLELKKQGKYQKPYEVILWTDVMPYRLKQFMDWVGWITPLMILIIAIPAFIHIYISFRFFLQGKMRDINLFRIFGLGSAYMQGVVFIWGLSLGVAACLTGLGLYKLLIGFADDWISELLAGTVALNFSGVRVPVIPTLTVLIGICLCCGFVSFWSARKVYRHSPSDLLFK